MGGRKGKTISTALRKVRKAVPKPTRVQASKKTYRRTAARRWVEESTADEAGC